MAASGAHLTSTALSVTDRPSIFEVLAQENLVSALHPALKHALHVLVQRNPARFGTLYRLSDEVYALFHLVLENFYLKHYAASFSENFYGLKRVPATQPDGGNSSLPRSLHFRSVLCLVFIPYVKRKCDDLFESLKERSTANPSGGLKKRICQAFLGIYPVLHSAYEALILFYQMAYIFSKSRVHSPLLHWAGVILSHLSMEDLQSQAPQNLPTAFHEMSLSEKGIVLSKRMLSTLAVAISSGISVGIFFLQFLEWWYASDQKAKSLTVLPNPPPPKVSESKKLPKLSSICPLCSKMRTNDTALSVTGYVFCYPCIHNYVRSHQKCPITGYPASVDHLVKLYVSNE